MEQNLIEAMTKLTESINELNNTLKKPLEVSIPVYETAIELKHSLQDLKISVDNLKDTMEEGNS